MILRVKNWHLHQHYKHRSPPWIKLKRSLLDDPEWHALPVASRALAPMLWLLASETKDGSIDAASTALAFRLRIASSELDEAIKPLIAGGWLIEPNPASVLLAPRLQHATSESEFRDQSTDTVSSNLTDPARDASLTPRGYATRASKPHETTSERVAVLAAKKRAAFQ